MITLNQNMEIEQNYVKRILIEDISNGVEKWSKTSNYDKNDKITLAIGKN